MAAVTTPELYELYLRHPRVSTDSRTVAEGDIFFALHGDNFDGNRFAAAALEKGAAAAVVDDPSVRGGVPQELRGRIVQVGDTLQALQALARHHRLCLGIPVIVVAGSNGKTTTKELLAAVLSRRFRTACTRGNLNNHIGVPLTLLSMDRDTEVAVVEAGASACGEIAALCSIARPDMGVLTNVGRCHLEGFGGVEGVRRGKGELYDWLARSGGMAFCRTDDPVLASMAAERPGLRLTPYTAAAAEGFASRLAGDYNSYNIAAAVTVGRTLGVAEEDIRAAVAEYVPSNHRSQLIETTRNTVIADCYNANPSSMAAAMDNLAASTLPQPRWAVLGDMLELGEWSAAEHRAVLERAVRCGVARLLLVGERFAEAWREIVAAKGDSAPGGVAAECFADREALAERLAAEPPSGCLILVKGSHGIGLEKILELL